MDKRLVDTNLIVRYLEQDHDRHTEITARLLEKCDRGEVTLVLLSAVVAECVFVLESAYARERRNIAEALSAFIESPGIELVQTDIHLDALRRYGESRLHFVDCVLAASAASEGIPVATFDAGFKKFSDVRVEVS